MITKNKIKMTTIKYYTNENKYMGWNKYSNKNYLELINWINSGNYVVINNKKIKIVTN